MTGNVTYRRGQVDWALWRWFIFPPPREATAPPEFSTRIKRLLDQDRAEESDDVSEPFDDNYAFFDDEPEGHGVDVGYTPFNAFCLAVALDLLDAGFKQSEIIFFVRAVRRNLLKQFKLILKCPPVTRQRVFAKHRPNCPSYKEGNTRWADCRVFMVIQKHAVQEAHPNLSAGHPTRMPLIFDPKYCPGISALTEELHDMGNRPSNRQNLVLEIAGTVTIINDLLRVAPEVKRGPQ